MESQMDSFMDLVSTEEVLQSKVVMYGTIYRLESDVLESMDEGQSRILHHVDKRRMAEYC